MNTAMQDAFDLAWKLGWFFNGWGGPDLLHSYEDERRPVGAHNVTRTADPNGAQQQAAEALPWDLHGRVAHVWLELDGKKVSTLDLIGDGITLLRGPAAGGLARTTDRLHARAPIAVHDLDPATAEALDVPGDGAILLRPDGKQLDGLRHLPNRQPLS